MAAVQRLLTAAVIAALCLAVPLPAAAAERPVRIVALGDSLTAGLGLPANEAFPARLEAALKAKGIAATVANAGVSGDTASGGLGRLAWSVPDGTDAVILELGANDALRGLDPALTKAALEKILGKLENRHIAVLLAGMQSPRNMGADYVKAFDGIYPALASNSSARLLSVLPRRGGDRRQAQSGRRPAPHRRRGRCDRGADHAPGRSADFPRARRARIVTGRVIAKNMSST